MAEIVAHHVWRNVDRRGPDECWPWLGARNKRGGHGVAYIGHTRSMAAHRAVYTLEVGPVPRHLVLDHLCKNPACVNPAHCEPVTQRVNVQRGTVAEVQAARMKAKTHCPQGHEYTPENIHPYRTRKGTIGRMCRECGRIRCRAYRARHVDNIEIS